MPVDQSQSNTGMFVPETNVWEIAQLRDVNVNAPEFKELLVRLYQNINNIAIALNQKDTGVYPLTEFLNSQAWFPNPSTSAVTNRQPQYRGDYRIVINFGALPAAGTKSVPHNLSPTPNWSWTRIYATATNPVTFAGLPIPYASNIPNANIELNIDATNVNITTAMDYSAFTICYVVIEMLKN